MLIPPLTRWVRPRLAPLALGLFLAPLGAVLIGQGAPEPVRGRPASIAAAGESATSWGRQIESMERAGALRLRSSVEDTMLEGRVHDRFDQYLDGVRIFGAQLVRQRSAAGVESVFGSVFPEGLRVSTTPALSAEDVVARVVTLSGRSPIGGRAPELVILPREDGTFRLTWLTRARLAKDAVALFLDAQTGEEVWRYSLIQRQSAVGTGTGVLGDRKKLSTRQASGVFLADDTLRPPTLITYDLKGSWERVLQILFDELVPTQADIASDTDNTWTDGANVDGHAYLGFTYDYYFQRFGRRGLDGSNHAIRSIVHPAPREDPLSLPDFVLDNFLLNAFWCGECGLPGQGYMVFGEGLPTRFTLGGQNFNFWAGGFDVVAHELSHAVTEFTSGLIYENESGALNESFSDIMGVGAEFYARSSGRSDRTPDYLVGEDIVTPARAGALIGIRSLSDPLSFGDPDHYSLRYTGPEDSGGVHINSGISNHAFFLAIEGGTNRTSGLAVTGVGGANREQIERIFYRGFTSYLTPNATFAQARQATLRAAAELSGDTSAAFRAVQQAWTAVGVN
ncbi:MAG: M4 family metallopeptidase [Vicinamibacteraceae bacterium]